MAIVVNLLLVVLVLAVGIAVGRATTPGKLPTASIAPPQCPAPSLANLFQTRVPEAASILPSWATRSSARLNRNERDERLFLALRDYTIASQSCRRGYAVARPLVLPVTARV